ncbi:TPA: DUF2913 family protein [Klebsiella oxytoca]|nr:DUF2913 family protein [Klebsiella oxytoca]
MNSQTLTAKSGHLAWCALVALYLARRDGKVTSATQDNLFLTRWLAVALKQRRFPREVTPDLEWLLAQGRQFGARAELAKKLTYLWTSCTGALSEQNELFRLTFAIETAKGEGWMYRLFSDLEWAGRRAVALNAGVNGIYILRRSLDAAFDENGQQVSQLLARLTGNVKGLMPMFARCGWCAVPVEEPEAPYLYQLKAVQMV